MQSSEESSVDSLASQSTSPAQKKQHDQLKKTLSSKSSRPSPSSGLPSSAPKRLKTSHFSGNLGRSADTNMSKVGGIAAHPIVVDLTRPSNFQPNTGAKRLVIKNLRTTSRKDVDDYYDRTWNELELALSSVFSRRSPNSPLEVLCRGVEAICRRGRADKLFTHLKSRCKTYLEDILLPAIEKGSSSSNVDALRTVKQYWTQWTEQSVCLPF